MIDPLLYTIGWVCAILPELIAARLQLDHEHDDEYEAPVHDNNTYAFGSIGRHNVVIAALPTGEYGTNSAASVARDMVRSFSNLRVGFMVGVAGGAPLVEDIRLGDVVVGVPGNGKGGVFQYDYGKAVQEKEFQPTGHLNSPSMSVLTALTALRADIEIKGHGIEEAVGRFKYKRPEVDRLYNSTCDEEVVRGERAAIIVHYGLIASGNTLLKDAVLRDKFAKEGVLCFEMEAAGLMNQFPFLVIRGICDYADTHKNKDWQSYAAMTAAAYAKKVLLKLAVNKVAAESRLSDLEGIKKDIEHATERIEQVVTQVEAQANFALRVELDRWLDAPDQTTNHNNARECRYENSGNWLLKHESFLRWQNAEFNLLWLHGKSGCGKTVLSAAIVEYLQAPQAGPVIYFYFDTQDSKKQRKDNMLRSLVRQLSCLSATCHAKLEELYSSCNRGYSNASTKQLEDCLASMCQKNVTVVLDALDECRECEEVLAWMKSICADDVVRIVLTSRPEYEIIASLRRLPEEAKISIAGASVDEDIKAFVRFKIYNSTDGLSRWQGYPDVQEEIEESLLRQAGGMFRWVVCQLDTLRQCCKRQHLLQVLNSLPKGLDETYARILHQVPEVHLDDAIRLLQFLTYSERPLTLAEAVDALAIDLEHIPAFDPCNREPVPEEISRYCGSLTRITRRWHHESRILDLSKLDLGEVQDIVEIQLAHPSVKEFVLSGHVSGRFEYALQELRSKECIVRTSLAYLLHALSSERRDPDLDLPFRRYAAQYWIEHAVAAEKVEKAFRMIMKFFTTQEVYDRWLDIFNPDEARLTSKRSRPRRAAALYYAALVGLERTVVALLDDGACVDARGGTCYTALQAAARRGHASIVELLLDNSAAPNAQGGDYGTALVAAASHGAAEVVRKLIGRGSRVNARVGLHGHALGAAAYFGHTVVINILLREGASIDVKAGLHQNALCAAASRGHLDATRLLLDNGAAIFTRVAPGDDALVSAARGGHLQIVQLLLDQLSGSKHVHMGGQDALRAALSTDHVDVAKLLLEHGVDVNFTGDIHGNALQIASSRGSLDLVKLLIQKGALVNTEECGPEGTALTAAARRGSLEIVDLLLQHGADVRAKGGQDHNPVYVALYGQHYEIVRSLLRRGAKLDLQDYGDAFRAASSPELIDAIELLSRHDTDSGIDFGVIDQYLTVAASEGLFKAMRSLIGHSNTDISHGIDCPGHFLEAASSGGHSQAVERLLDNGTDVNAEGIAYPNALFAASANDRPNTVKLLLQRGASVNTIRDGQEAVLYHATRHGRTDIVDLLLQYGADVNAQGEHYYSNALQAACANGDTKTATILLRNGAQIDTNSGRYGNALQAASTSGHIEIVRLLISWGADVNLQGGEYGNALQGAVVGRSVEVVSLLLSEGASVNATGGYFSNALHAASIDGSSEMVQLLLSHGAAVNAQGRECGTALQAACARNTADVVRLLISHGADVTAQACDKGGVIHTALHRSDFDDNILEALFEVGGNALMIGSACNSVLVAASAAGDLRRMALLLDNGADVDGAGYDQHNALHAASSSGCIRAVQYLLSRGASLDKDGGQDGCALYAAVANGHFAVVELLIDAGINIDTKEGSLGSILRAASLHGETEVVQLLLRMGADVNMRGSDALQGAASADCGETAKVLIDNGALINVVSQFDDEVALHTAAFKGHSNMVRLLLDRGADVNMRGGRHGTALQAASAAAQVRIAKQLLLAGADVSASGGYHGNALQAASAANCTTMVELLLHRGADPNAVGGHHGSALLAASALHAGPQTNDAEVARSLEIIRLLLKAGADVNARGDTCGNALCVASSIGRASVVKLLLENAADANVRSEKYGSPLYVAADRGFSTIVQLLLDKGNIGDNSGQHGQALLAASRRGYTETVKLLLRKGSDDLLYRGEVSSALCLASAICHVEIMKLLINDGAIINTKGVDGYSPLQAALQAQDCLSEWQRKEAVRLLLEAGARPEGDTEVQVRRYKLFSGDKSSTREASEIVELLRSHDIAASCIE